MGSSLDATVAIVSSTAMASILGITAGTADETVMDELINEASIYIRTTTGRSTIMATALTEYYDGDGTATLLTRSWPINSVTSLYVDVDRAYGTDTEIDSDDIVIDNTIGGIKLDGDIFTPGIASVKLIYDAGWDTAPYDLQRACKSIVTYWYAQIREKRIGISGRSEGGQNVSYYAQDIPKDAARIISKYTDHSRNVA